MTHSLTQFSGHAVGIARLERSVLCVVHVHDSAHIYMYVAYLLHCAPREVVFVSSSCVHVHDSAHIYIYIYVCMYCECILHTRCIARLKRSVLCPDRSFLSTTYVCMAIIVHVHIYVYMYCECIYAHTRLGVYLYNNLCVYCHYIYACS